MLALYVVSGACINRIIEKTKMHALAATEMADAMPPLSRKKRAMTPADINGETRIKIMRVFNSI